MSKLEGQGRQGQNNRVSAQQRLDLARKAVQDATDDVITKDWPLTSTRKTAMNRTGAKHTIRCTAIDLGKLNGSQKHSYAYACRYAELDPESSAFLKCSSAKQSARGQYGTGIFMDASQALVHYSACHKFEIYNEAEESILAQATRSRSTSAAPSSTAGTGETVRSSATPGPLTQRPSASSAPANLSFRRSPSMSNTAGSTPVPTSTGFTAVNTRRVDTAGRVTKPYQAAATGPVAPLGMSRVMTVLDYSPVPPARLSAARASTPRQTPTSSPASVPAPISATQPTASRRSRQTRAAGAITRPLKPSPTPRVLRSSTKPLAPAVNTRRTGASTPARPPLVYGTRGTTTSSAAVPPLAGRTLRSASKPANTHASVLDGTAGPGVSGTPSRRSDRFLFQNL